MRLSVQELCGQDRVLREDGRRLREQIEARWDDAAKRAEPIEVDFDNVSVASVSFLDEAIAVLALEHALDEIAGRIRVVNILDPDRRLLSDLLQSRDEERRRRGDASVAPPVRR